MNLVSTILATIIFLIQKYADDDKQEDLRKTVAELYEDLNVPRISTYDFIVVGAGTAGSLVAGRLSERFNVLLLESGGDPVPTSATPFFKEILYSHPGINNVFTTIPQLNFSLERGGVLDMYCGRTLGGSGSINGNLHNRGSPLDYDDFARLTADDSWSYENVLEHFKNFENFVGELINESDREVFYSTGGPLTVDTHMPPIISAWFQSANELGYDIGDPNGNQTEGFTPVAVSVKNGVRDSTYTAFVKPFQNTRSTLTVLKYSDVEQVLINGSRAYGVVYRRHGIVQIAYASKEVIVSAGTMSSPMLLIKSGIGPREVLDEAQIPVMRELAGVGKNFRNHPAAILPFTVNNPNATLLPRLEVEDIENEIIKFHENQRHGLFTRMSMSAQAFIVSSVARADGELNWPDIQISFFQNPLIGNETQMVDLHVIGNRMKSIGEIGFNTTAYRNGERDDTKLALIDLQMFTVPSDVDTVIEGIELALRIFENTTSFQAMSVEYTEISPASCSALVYRSREYWECYLRERVILYSHWSSTCSMGVQTDPLAVVDSKLRVFGIQGLRVVDASVMPRPTNADINAGVMVIAEKASQDILADYMSDGSQMKTFR